MKNVHPWQLSEEEISAVADTVRSHLGADEQLRFVAISLRETAEKTERQAEVISLEPTTGLVREFLVELDEDKLSVVSEKSLPLGTQPLLTPDDCFLAEEIVQQSTEMADILNERYGITDLSRVACDPWSVHLACEEDVKELVLSSKSRLVQTFLYHRQYGKDMEDNQYAHPIDVLPVVCLNTRTIVKIQGLDRPPPKIPTASVQYHRDLIATNTYLASTWRQDLLTDLNVLQDQGPSFTVTNDTAVEWQKWKFDVAFHYREGLVLHNISFDGRSICRRASLVEMAVPYADPHPPFTRKCAFDVGDYGLGYCANSLELGCDCLGHIHYFDGVVCDFAGNPVLKKKVVCMHEQDNGLLWKHVEYRNGHNESRRSRELILSFIATVVNYEYLFYWHFRQDGTIELEIKLSGELSTNLLSEGEETPSHGVMVAPNVNAQVHQHMFCARLDMAVDGPLNTVSEVDIVSQPVGPNNPYGNAFGTVETILTTEQEAIRKYDANKARSWKISNASGSVNSINGKPTAYKLLPFTRGTAQPTVLVDPTSAVARKGAFSTSNLWVTPYSPEERYPAGEYTPQGDGSNGLPDWTAKDRSLVGQDLVIWHSFGVCHVPRTEDFPVMPCETSGFMLKPDNFFVGNPAVDLPPDRNKASALANGCCGTK